MPANASSDGVLLSRYRKAVAACAVMNADPFVQDGVMRAELFPFRIVHIRESNAS